MSMYIANRVCTFSESMLLHLFHPLQHLMQLHRLCMSETHGHWHHQDVVMHPQSSIQFIETSPSILRDMPWVKLIDHKVV